MQKPDVLLDLCEGCGTCAELCPEVFEMKLDGKAYVKGYDKCNTCNCQETANMCPVHAIVFTD